jgi:hypothetical protein
MIGLTELKTILEEATGIPVAYSHFKQSDNEPVPPPPFITYLVVSSSNFMADNKVYKQLQDIEIELYTDRKDINVEKKIEAALQEHEIPFETFEEFIESEKLYQKIYEVRLFTDA